jgi:hypothetical protein
MTMTNRTLAACFLLAVVSCGDDGITDPNPPLITLSAQQAATISASAEDISALHPELEWLADSIEVVVRAGAQAKRIEIRENGEPLVFYAVSLQRDVVTSTSSFATWHLIAFDNATDPSVFVVANGFAQGTGTTPPISVNGGFGGQSAFAHVIVIEDNGALTDRRAITGGASFSAKSVGGACPVVGTPPANVTCNIAEMDVGFDIVQVSPPAPASSTLNLLSVSVPGVKLTIEE